MIPSLNRPPWLSSCFLSFQPLKNNKFRIHKSRYDSIDSYLSCCGEKYNDIELTKDEEIYKQLLDAGEGMAGLCGSCVSIHLQTIEQEYG